MTTLSLQYLKTKLKLCWSADALEAAAALWPSNPTWAWFLGARLLEMTRAAAMDRVNVAIAHAYHARVQLPRRPSVLLAFFREAQHAELCAVAAAMGACLDDPSPELCAALEALLPPPPGLIEAAPPIAEAQPEHEAPALEGEPLPPPAHEEPSPEAAPPMAAEQDDHP
jgi:hypothetical protein